MDILVFDLIIILWPGTKAFGGVIWWTSEEVGHAWGDVLGKEVCIGEVLGEVSGKKICIGEMLDSRIYAGERYAEEASVAVATVVGDWEYDISSWMIREEKNLDEVGEEEEKRCEHEEAYEALIEEKSTLDS